MNYQNQYAHEVDELILACRRLAQNMYVTSEGGNLAWRLEPDLILITPTQVRKEEIKPDDVVFIDLSGKVVQGEHRPTGETPMYLNFMKKRPDIVSVVHCHPPSAGAMAISSEKNWLMRPLYPETIIEIGPVPVVPYAEPLTEKLARNFEPFLPKYNNFIMENHGLVSMSRRNLRWTLGQIELLEMTARSIVMACQMGGIRELDRQAVSDLNRVMKTRNLPMCGAPGVNESLEALYFETVEP
jgi:L-fuculose-phosphate aldolase